VGGPLVLWLKLKLKSKCVGPPQRGQGGQVEAAGSDLSATVSPNWSALPECNWTRMRLALAVGWQKP
jgi:hypothetical protein